MDKAQEVTLSTYSNFVHARSYIMNTPHLIFRYPAAEMMRRNSLYTQENFILGAADPSLQERSTDF